MANKGFIRDWLGNQILPITRGELVLDAQGNVALTSDLFLAGTFKDAQGRSLPGLITAAERAMLSGSGGSGGISDIYDKLSYINNGLTVKGQILHFYDDNGVATPINIVSTGEGLLDILVADNTVNLSLKNLTEEGTSASDIIKSITVDKYGRVTSVLGSKLTNEEIPEILSGKQIQSSTLSDCKTEVETIGTDKTSIVNKAYVDSKIAEVSGVASGALKFAGAIKTLQYAKQLLNNANNFSNYYKVTGEFTLPAEYLYSDTEAGSDGKVKPGDTLIIKAIDAINSKFVHVPSGDDITRLTVKEEGSASSAIDGMIGPLSLVFSSIFDVSSQNSGYTAHIALPQANSTTSGYLSNTDYQRFSASADKSITYESELSGNELGAYLLGTLTIGTVEHKLYGKSNVTALTLNNGKTNAYNPILKFTEGSEEKEFTLKGVNGIAVKKNGDDVEFTAVNEIAEGSEDYLETNGYQFGVKIGSMDGIYINPGLTDYAEFADFRTVILAKGVLFDNITYSLKDTATPGQNDPYRYGNTALATAVNVTI